MPSLSSAGLETVVLPRATMDWLVGGFFFFFLTTDRKVVRRRSLIASSDISGAARIRPGLAYTYPDA